MPSNETLRQEVLGMQVRDQEMLGAAVAAGEASGWNLAYLTDRVRVHEGLPQVYGTQGEWVDGKLALGNIEDADGVDQRRAAIGLEPVAKYLATLKLHYGDDSP